MRYRDKALPTLQNLGDGTFRNRQDNNWKLLERIDRQAAKKGELLWRYIREPWADGYAYYQIVAVTGCRVRIEVCRGLGDDWVVPYWGEADVVRLIYARDNVARRDRMTALFTKPLKKARHDY